MEEPKARANGVRIFLWLSLVALASLLISSSPFGTAQSLSGALSSFGAWLWLFYGAMSVLCALVLIPSMPLVLAAAMIYPDRPVTAVLLACFGVLCSSLFIYEFAGYVGLRAQIQASKKFQAARTFIAQRGAYALALWAATPFLPTDVACYVASASGMRRSRYLLAICFGEGLLCAALIFSAQAVV